MKKLLSLLVCVMAVSPLCAQRYILRDGKVVNQADVTLKGSNLVQQIAGGSAEISYPISQVVRLEWPEPKEINQARELLAAGKGAEAEEKITPIYRQFAPFPKLPGSWWSEAALVRARALVAAGKSAEAERAARELISTAPDPDDVSAAQLIIARLQIIQGKADIADAMLDEIMHKDASSYVSARAAVLRGDIAFERKEFEKALEFYLHVPAFYGDEEEVLPAALLGSARSYRGYGDTARAERAYLDVTVAYPNSSEAAVAKREMAKL